jgi:hypothetical protein
MGRMNIIPHHVFRVCLPDVAAAVCVLEVQNACLHLGNNLLDLIASRR